MKMNLLLLLPLMLLGMSHCNTPEENGSGGKNQGGNYVPGDPTEIEGDILIKVASGMASQYQNGENIEKSFDGNMNTLYHSPYWGTKFPVTLEYRFAAPENVDYIVQKPRTGGGNGTFGEAELFVATKENPNFIKIGDYDFKFSQNAFPITFDKPIEGATAFRFVVKSGNNDLVSCAEMEFYRYGNGAKVSDFSDVFADNVLSELRDGVTREKIESLDNQFFRSIALAMLDQKYDREFRVQEFEPFPTLRKTATDLKIGNYCPFENPTGIYFSSGSDIVIIVGDTGGESVSLQIHNFSNNSGQNFLLREGINKFSLKNNGLGYISYYTDNWQNAPKIKMHIATGKVNGYFDKAIHSVADWRRLIDNAVSSYFDLKGEWINLAYTTEDLREYCPNAVELMDVYDEIVTMEHEIMGLVKYDLRPKNHMFGRTVESGMFADGWGIGLEKPAMFNACDPEGIKSASWMVAHELGHVNQIRPGLKWLGTTEVTNNIYSALVAYHYTGKIGIETEKCLIENGVSELGGRMNCFLTYGIARGEPWMYQWGQDKTTDYAEKGGDHFVKLCPLWQLMLYYRLSDGAPWQKRDWYADVAQRVRETDDSKFTNGEHQINFMRNTMDILEQDLSDFFIKAGMLVAIDRAMFDYSDGRLTISQAQVDELVEYAKKYPKPASPVIFYLSSQSLPAYINQRDVTGSFGQGMIDNGNNTFTISHNIWKNVAVFETYAGNRLDRVAMVGTDSPDRSTTRVRYPAGSTRIEAVGWDGKRTLVYGNR